MQVRIPDEGDHHSGGRRSGFRRIPISVPGEGDHRSGLKVISDGVVTEGDRNRPEQCVEKSAGLGGRDDPIDDPVTGEQRQAQLSVAVLAASNYIYAETPASVASVAGT